MASGRSRAHGKSLASPLARVGDPLVLADGRRIEPTPAGGVVVEKSDAKPKEFKSTKRRNISDLPAEPRVLNGIACVFVYTILGVGDREIANALNIPVSHVREVKKHPGYAEIFDLVQDEFINIESDSIQSRIAAMGNDAIAQMFQLAMNGKFESTKLKASQDILDRGGHTRKEAMKMGGGDALKIVVSKGNSETQVRVEI